MWKDKEWYDYMETYNIPDPYKQEENATLSGFFS